MKQNSNKLKFTGERLIPKLNKNTAFYYEHINRYLFANQFSQNNTILDCACGTGYGSFLMSKYGKAKKVIGIDISTESINYAKTYYSRKNINYINDDISKLNKIKDQSIDVITSFETIEHISKPIIALKQFNRVLKKNGFLIISTPNKDNYSENNKFHICELNRRQFEKILKKYFKNIRILNQKYSLSQDIYTDYPIPDIAFNNQKISRSNLSNYAIQDIKSKPEYFIAICSNVKLPAIILQQISINSVDNISLEQGIIPLEKKYAILQNKLSEITSSKLYKLWPLYCKIKNIFIK